MIGRLPLDEQLATLKSVLSRNEVLLEVLDRTASMALPGWYVTAGCLFQTVWNVVTDRLPTSGIKDYDVFYFDNGDLSWEAEDAVIKAGEEVFAGLPAEVEIRNEARVHLWYEQKFGVACAPYSSTEAAIDSFAATTCCLGVRLEPAGRWRVYAPHGLSDVFNLVVRPNPVLAPRDVYESKSARWRQQWPELTVLDWPTRAAAQ
ncbi:nucleotidyltransferase family protein [Streptomyces sp. NPDC001410]|uniref:nucleotidyltransferase family protein n=1 Tax=Streptomyces sp. NPDC001410 TaxID=3364574 RepID=UPI0036C0FDCF